VSARFRIFDPKEEITRARRILEVLVRNGLGFVVENVGLSRLLPRRRSRQLQERDAAAGLTVPQRVRLTLEQLGTTYIKLGQILSTRPDLLPPAYIVELSKLLDSAPPVPTDEIVRVIEQELGGPVERWFADFERQPIASASIGQVHRATLQDGTAVVIKAQRPGVERLVQADLNLIMSQARFLQARSSALRRYGLVDILEEFSNSLRDELDYTYEARNAERLRAMVGGEGVAIPRVYWDLTTRRVIVLSELKGIQLNEVDRLRGHGYDLSSIAARVVEVYLELVFKHGIFHADPHPANILVCDRRIGLIDFGVIGYLTPRIREDLGALLMALVQQDADEMVHIIARMGAVSGGTERDAMRRDVQRLIVRYYSASLESLPLAQFLSDILSISFKHHVRLPSDLALLVRTVVILEGVALGLDPSFVLTAILEPFVVQLARERLSPRRAVEEVVRTWGELESVIHVLPRRVDNITRQLEQGQLTIGFEVRRLEQALRKADAIGNRLVFSIIVAAIIVGSALVLQGGDQASLFRLPLTDIVLPIPELGFVASALIGIWMLYSIVRSRKM
jgi:ubiquinone biosynthesis protein